MFSILNKCEGLAVQVEIRVMGLFDKISTPIRFLHIKLIFLLTYVYKVERKLFFLIKKDFYFKNK